jgi:CDP-paratose 2-epimerase
MKQVTVTGGAGFIGAHLANYYLDRGHRVTIYDTLARRGCLRNVEWLRSHPNAHNLHVLVGDIRLPTRALRQAVEASDAVFHFAAQVAVTTSVLDPVEDFEVNALGTLRMLELVRSSPTKRAAFFFASTNKVYGAMEDIRVVDCGERYAYRDYHEGIAERQPLDFHSPYGCSNGAADQYVRDYARIYGLQTVVFRQSCIYGHRQFGLEDQGWVAWFAIAALLGHPITIYGDGKQVRDILFIDDLIRAYALAWERIDSVTGQIYNIGGGPRNAVSLRELIGILRSEIGPALRVTHSAWRPGDQRVYVSDIGKASSDFAWRPEVDWKDGLQRLIDWVRAHQGMLASVFAMRE